MKKLFQIIIITPEKFIKNEIFSICKILNTKGSLLHLRKPDFSKEEMELYLRQFPESILNRIVLHSHYELVKTFKLRGAHLTENSRTSFKKINFLKRNKIKIISTSFHSVKEIKLSRRKYEYVFLSPVFDSISKLNYKSNFNPEKLNPFLKTNKSKIIALGGITLDNVVLAKQVGFSGAASIGYIWESKSPLKNYKALTSKVN